MADDPKQYPPLAEVSKTLRALSIADIRAATHGERQEFLAICDGISSCIAAQTAYERDGSVSNAREINSGFEPGTK